MYPYPFIRSVFGILVVVTMNTLLSSSAVAQEQTNKSYAYRGGKA